MIVHLLPAGEGDCLLIKSGDDADATTILIDGGRMSSYPHWKGLLKSAIEPATSVNLAVVSHVDADHISGIVALLRDPDGVKVADVWFNAYRHVRSAKKEVEQLEPFGVSGGDKLSKLIEGLEIPWNRSFAGDRVVVEPGAAPVSVAVGGMRLTCLSPDDGRLAAMEPSWTAWLDREGMLKDGPDPPPTLAGVERFGSDRPNVEALWQATESPDSSIPNGSSIALLIEVAGKTVLMAADAHPTMLEESIEKLSGGGKLDVDLFKISHHGSKASTTKRLLDKIKCRNFAFTTNGRHDLPNLETIAKIIKSTKEKKFLFFNYRHEFTECWDDKELKLIYNYETIFPECLQGYLKIKL